MQKLIGANLTCCTWPEQKTNKSEKGQSPGSQSIVMCINSLRWKMIG